MSENFNWDLQRMEIFWQRLYGTTQCRLVYEYRFGKDRLMVIVVTPQPNAYAVQTRMMCCRLLESYVRALRHCQRLPISIALSLTAHNTARTSQAELKEPKASLSAVVGITPS